MRTVFLSLLAICCYVDCSEAAEVTSGTSWARHTIDDSSRGADGVRLMDVNYDGLPDITTGWEEGGVVRVYLNPGRTRAGQKWPGVSVGRVRSPEDAVFADLDVDGFVDVVSCCEGSVQSMFIHWAPNDRERFLDPSAWTTCAIPATEGMRRWMFCVPAQVDGRNGIDLIAGAKNPHAAVGWLESPPDARNVSDWRWHPICDAAWIMSIKLADLDSDGDSDLMITDRKGPNRGCHWLENPGTTHVSSQPWKDHPIGGMGQEVMFMDHTDLDGDGLLDIIVPVRGADILFLRRDSQQPPKWTTHSIRMPLDSGTGKAAAATDIDGDGRTDLVVSCEHSEGKHGVFWMSYEDSPTDSKWTAHAISGKGHGVKFDLVQLYDLDADGDQDVITCEERDNLGVIWYENPVR